MLGFRHGGYVCGTSQGIFSLLLVVAGAWMDGKEGARSRRFSFLVFFLRLLRLLREALVGLRLVWVPGRKAGKRDGAVFGR